MNVARAPGGRRPLDQADQPEPTDPPKLAAIVTAFTIAIYHLLLSPQAYTHFTIPQRVEG